MGSETEREQERTLGGGAVRRIGRLRAQRDRLVEAVEACEQNLRVIHGADGKEQTMERGTPSTFEAWKAARDALEAVEGDGVEETPPENPDEMCHCKDISVAHTVGDHYEERRSAAPQDADASEEMCECGHPRAGHKKPGDFGKREGKCVFAPECPCREFRFDDRLKGQGDQSDYTRWEIFKALREAYGCTVREVAERTGVSPSYVSEVENHHISPSYRYVVKFADAFDLYREWLLVRSGHLPTAAVKCRPSVQEVREMMRAVGYRKDSDSRSTL